jgi:hypothetical protein
MNVNMQSKSGTHISIAEQASDAWDEAALELAAALGKSERKRSRERFGMPLDQREALTRFARIDSKEKLEAFQRAFPDFFPAMFWNSWTYRPEIPRSKPIPFWRVWQRLLLDAWRADFHADYRIQLTSVLLGDPMMITLPEWDKDAKVYREPQIGIELADAKKLKQRCIEIQPVHDFQRAVEAMGASPWRAAFCSKCSLPFVADKPQRDYCSDKCRKARHQLAWRDRWEKYGKKWRQKQRTQKAKRRRAAA